MFELLSPTDRCLWLTVKDLDKLDECIRRVSRGVVVGLGGHPDLQTARERFRDFDCAMFTPGDRAEIPWREGFFNRLIDPDGGPLTGAMRQVLAAGGELWTTGGAPAIGFREIEPAPPFRRFRKEETTR